MNWISCNDFFQNNPIESPWDHWKPIFNLTKWVFPKIMVPPNHPLLNRVFHYFNHPFWGTIILGNPQNGDISSPIFFGDLDTLLENSPIGLANSKIFVRLGRAWGSLFWAAKMKLLLGKSVFELYQFIGFQENRMYSRYQSSTFKSHGGFGWGTVEKHEILLLSAQDYMSTLNILPMKPISKYQTHSTKPDLQIGDIYRRLTLGRSR